MTLSELGTPVSLIGLGLTIAGLIWKGGQLSMEVKKNDEKHENALRKLEETHGRELRELKVLISTALAQNITRAELDARFADVKSQLTAVGDRMDDAVSILKEALKR